jgi:zinc protease
LAFLSLVLSAAPAPGQYTTRVHESVLPNGLKVLVLEDHKAPVAVFQVWYRVGSRNEALGRTGLSHILEHMMFKGTERVAPDEYTRIIQVNGGQTNAFTTQDYTMYFASIASDRLDVVMDLEADRMTNVVLDAERFNPERDVVVEERRLRVDNSPVAAMFEELRAVAYSAHPYEFPTIGWMEDIRKLTVDDLNRYYRAHYLPNNAFLVVIGDVDAARFVESARRAFEKTAAGPSPDTVRSVEPVQRGERRVELHREAELPFVALAFHVPNITSIDGPVLEVLEAILGGGESSRLNHELVYRRRIAHEVGAEYDTLSADPGLFLAYGQPLPGKSIADMEQALRLEIERIRTSPPGAAELARAKKSIEARYVFAQDSLFYQGLWLGQYEILGDWRRIDTYLPAIRSVTADDILRVAHAYLDRNNQTVGTLVPTSSVPVRTSNRSAQ